ncbi:MAG: hypothetical protein IT563_08580 [Alphaproteobacteria bacterium]|nr:hypothetical protein [Alphaproteobacteria bacterium]
MRLSALAAASLAFGLLALVGAGGGVRADDRDDSSVTPRVGEQEMPQSNMGVDPTKAVVVVGLAANDDENIELVRLLFGRNDPATGDWMKDGFLRDEFAVERRTRSFFYKVGEKVDPTVPVYRVAEINPGEWVLHSLYAVYGKEKKENRTTKLFPKGQEKLGESTGPRFVVKAGEVVYIGTYVLNATDFPAQIVRVTRDDDAAKQAFAAQSKLQSAPVWRPVYQKKP